MTQRRTVLKGLATAALLPLAGHAMAQSGNMPVNPDDIETDSGEIVIQPVNHATLVLTYDSDLVLLAARFDNSEHFFTDSSRLPIPCYAPCGARLGGTSSGQIRPGLGQRFSNKNRALARPARNRRPL